MATKEKRRGLRIRILADKSVAGPPFPRIGVMLESAPKLAAIPTKVVQRAMSEQYATLVGSRPVNYPGGPAEDPWRKVHTFIEADQIVFHTVDGDVVYDVTKQPGKSGEAGDSAAVVNHFYEADRNDG